MSDQGVSHPRGDEMEGTRLPLSSSLEFVQVQPTLTGNEPRNTLGQPRSWVVAERWLTNWRRR